MRRRSLILAVLGTLLLATGAVVLQHLHPIRASVSAPSPPPSSPADPQPPTDPQTPAGPPAPPPPHLVAYTGPVEHIFFHPLIAYPELAFDGDNMAQGYDDWFVTVPEFKQMLPALYEHGYMLIHAESLLTAQPLMLPEGKKPLILSIDDVNYYDYMRQNGNIYRLIVDSNGRIATYAINPKGQEEISYDNDIIPILDSFVASHPDFALDGAKGIIAETGYEGVLGYRTNDPSTPTDAVKQLIQRLKETGWSFASHSWGHLDMAKVSYNTFVRDTDRWKAEVEPLIGPTPVYIYPFGSMPPLGDPKAAYLLKSGFRLLCTVGPTPYQPQPQVGQYVLMERRHIDGMALRTQGRMLAHLFDAGAVIDPVRPKPKR